MKPYFYKFFLFSLVFNLFLSSATFAQNTGTGKLTGKVVDAQNNETVPFASAVVIDNGSKAVIRTAQTDANGSLVIPGLPSGSFTVKISYVGYQTMVKNNVSLATGKEFNLGTVKMSASKGNVLNEVAITGQKSPMQLGIDKKVFSVEQSLVSEGGSATDLLANVPSVQTDVDGNVSLRGSSGVRVLIDGKPSLIAGGNVAQILQSIPASSIESVEVITNPSSKYDAEGQSGIINIVLKKNTKLGLNGNVALTAGNRNNYNANTSLSFQNKKVNLYGNYSFRRGNRPGGGFNNIQYLQPIDSLGFADQMTNSKGTDNSHNVKAGMDYYLTSKDVLSFSGGFNMRENDRNEFLNINKYDVNRSPLELSTRTNTNLGSGKSFDTNLDYTHKFKPGEELSVNFGFSKGNNDNFQEYLTDLLNINGVDPGDGERRTNQNNGDNKNINIQADYNTSLGKTGKIEAGYRSQIRYSDNSTAALLYDFDAESYLPDYRLSNLFDSKDQVHALYMNYQNQIGNFGYQVGLRAEDASLVSNSGGYDLSNQLVNAASKIAYKRLYPSLYLTQKMKNDQQVQLSYSRRVNRPRPWDTNPFIDYGDPLNWRRGNPNLLPEDVHAFELGYSKFWKKVTLISSAYVRNTNDVIQRVRSQPDANGVIISTPQNLAQELSSGLELIAKVDVAKPWNFTANVNVYHSKIKAVPAFNIAGNSGYSWNTNLTNNFVLPHGITVQIRGEYNSERVMAQGKMKAMYSVDGGAKYDFPGKKASLGINVRDIFNIRKFGMTTNDGRSVVDFQRYMKGPMGNITFSYRFGKTLFEKKAKKPEAVDARPEEGQF